MTDEQIRKVQADAIFQFSQKFSDGNAGVSASSRETKAYIKAVMSGKNYKPPSTEGCHA